MKPTRPFNSNDFYVFFKTFPLIRCFVHVTLCGLFQLLRSFEYKELISEKGIVKFPSILCIIRQPTITSTKLWLPRQRGCPAEVRVSYANPISNYILVPPLIAVTASSKTTCICLLQRLPNFWAYRRFYYAAVNDASCLRHGRNVMT